MKANTYSLKTISLTEKDFTHEIIESIEKHGYAIFNRCLSPENVLNATREYELCMRSEPLYAQGKKFKPTDLVLAPWRKQSIGSHSGNGEPYSQILQTTYFHQDDARYPTLSEIFSDMILLRNALTGMRLDYGNNLDKDKFWNACRMHHYPKGGGHMGPHRDTLFPELLNNFKIPFIQIMLTLTSRGVDFQTGGSYLVNRYGQKIFFETNNNAGTLVLFDGATIHGVDDVDPTELLDFTSLKGRKALFVNLYKNLLLDEYLDTNVN